MRLSDEELRDVLARAEEIERTTRRGDAWNAELAAVIGAAEEVGLSRRAVEQALAERLKLPAAPPAVGELVWARTAEGRFFVATVLAVAEEGVRVRFLVGGEHRVTLDELRTCSFMPGERVVCQWPMWGRWNCTILSYDAEKQRVKVDDGGGYTRTFPIGEIWLPAGDLDARSARRRLYAKLLGAGAAAGALIGALLTAFLS